MKKINASFYSKDYQNKYSVSALIRRATNQNNVSSNDPTCLPLYDNEMAHDSIVVSVFDGRQSNAIASCIVHVSDMFASDMARLNGKVYVDARQIAPKVSTYTASPAQTDIQATANLLISMKFNRTEDAKMVSAGTEIKVPVYINNVKNN